MPTVDFLPFAIGGGADVQDQADWLTNPAVTNGFEVGVADPAQCNKAWRQASFVSAAIANYMANVIDQNVLDNGNLSAFWSQFWQALLAGTYFVDTGVANSWLTAPPFGLTFPAPIAGLRISLKVANTTTSTAVSLNWMGTGSASVVYPGGVSLNAGDIVANSVITLEFDGINWELVTITPAALFNFVGIYGRRRLTGPLTLFTNFATGSNVTGNGTSGNPYQTLQFAYDFLQSNIDAAGNQLTINQQAGAADTVGLNALGGVPGAAMVDLVLAAGVAVTGAANGISAVGGAQLKITMTGGSISASGTSPGFGYGLAAAGAGSILTIDSGVNIGACGNGAVQATVNAQVNCSSIATLNIAAASPTIFQVILNATIVLNPITITSTGTLVVTNIFLCTENGVASAPFGAISWGGASFTGSQYFISTAGGLQTGDSGATIPGSVGGTVTAPGWLT